MPRFMAEKAHAAHEHVDERSTRRPLERLLALEGGCNFRDVGGYRTQSGATVRWGQVYRAGVLSYCTDADLRTLQQLGVRAICDLRRAEERRREPTDWPDPATHHLFWDDDEDAPTLRAFAARHAPDPAGMRAAMIDLYRALPDWMISRIAGLFGCLAAGNLPLVVHCAAGKDRTGIAVAVLLLTLGVPRATVLEDYLMTNEAGDFEQFLRSRRHSELGLAADHHPLLELPAEIRRVLLGAEPDYLEAALEQIDADYGSLENYLERAVGVDHTMRQRVRARLLG